MTPFSFFDNERVELYHLKNDPLESTNLADQHPEQVAKMLKQLKAWYADTQKTATPQPGGWTAGK